MALPVTLTSATLGAQNSYHGPFRSSAGKYYAITISPTATDQIAAWMATDPTTSFAVQDASAEPDTAASAIQSLWTYQKDDILYIAVQTAVDDVYHAQFDMASGTDGAWVEITTNNTEDLVVDLLSETQADAVSIAVRGGASGEIVIAYQANPSTNKDMGGSFEQVAYAVSTDSGVGATWSINNDSTDDQSVGDISHVGETDFVGPVIVMGTGTLGSERIHFFFQDDTNDDAYQRTLSGADALETFPSAFDDTLPTVSLYLFGRGVLLDDTVYCPYIDLDGQIDIASFVSADAPVISLEATASDSDTIRGMSLALDGSDIHLTYVENTDDDVHSAVNTGSGFGTDVELFAGVGGAVILRAHSNIYDRDGPKIGVIYDENGTVKYNEGVITYTFGLLSDVKMGKQNSFHGPFET